MKSLKLFSAVGLSLMLLFTSGCGATHSRDPAKGSGDESALPQINKEEINTLLSAASKHDSTFYEGGPYTTEEVHIYFKKYFTPDYIEENILNGGNIKQENGEWILAFPGSEFMEGTYFHNLFTDETEVKQISAKEIKVINSLGDGLYAQHKELISLIYTDDGWKIHGLKWEYE